MEVTVGAGAVLAFIGVIVIALLARQVVEMLSPLQHDFLEPGADDPPELRFDWEETVVDEENSKIKRLKLKEEEDIAKYSIGPGDVIYAEPEDEDTVEPVLNVWAVVPVEGGQDE